MMKRYPIPEEYPHIPASIAVDGEWVVPDEPVFYSKTSKRRYYYYLTKGKGFDVYKRLFNQRFGRRDSASHSPRKVILFLHGGAYIFGNSKLYRSMTGILAKNTGHPVLAINYRRG
jgi:acetyl esterase/lipase